MFVTKNTSNIYNIKFIHTEKFAYGGLDLADSSTLTMNPTRWSPSKLGKTIMNQFPSIGSKEGAQVGR
jgi:hypothetical protein